MTDSILQKEDYVEPCCPLKNPKDITPVPIGRIISKLDEYLFANDYASAERHLIYWLNDAKSCGDMHGMLSLLNEQIGLYRKEAKEEECLCAAKEALKLADELCLDGNISYGTTLINVATAYKAFGKAENALPLYEKAKLLYEKLLCPTDIKLGGLYNNMALTLAELEDYSQARELFSQALDIMSQNENGELEMAITYCNLADLAAVEYGLEAAEAEISSCLEKAEELLNCKTLPKNGYYAFVCEKCAPTFGYYGYFIFEQDLKKRAEDIYARA